MSGFALKLRMMVGGIRGWSRRRLAEDRGAISVEYAGLLIFIAAIITLLVGSGIAGDIVQGIQNAVNDVLNAG